MATGLVGFEMMLPNNTHHRRAILRRLLAGSQIVYPVMIWANCGGDPVDFDLSKQLALCEDLTALGYKRRLRTGRNASSGHTMSYWHRAEDWDDDFVGPMPNFGPPLAIDE